MINEVDGGLIAATEENDSDRSQAHGDDMTEVLQERETERGCRVTQNGSLEFRATPFNKTGDSF